MIVINGDHFFDLPGFYEEVSKVFMKDTDWKVGTLDGFNDILYGGYGVFDNKEEVQIIWKNSLKSQQDLGVEATRMFYESKIIQGKPFNVELIYKKLEELLVGSGQTLFDILIEIIQCHENNITLILE